jgi:ribosomal small subunit protein bTHX
MGKGDKKSKKGKRFRHSYGKTRLRKKNWKRPVVKKVDEKQIEQKKAVKPESQFEKPIVTETKVVDVEIKTPEVKEIKPEEKPSEVKEIPVAEVAAIREEPKEEIKKEVETVAKVEEKVEIKTESPMVKETVEEEAQKPAPKKRGRPPKKKTE